MKQRVFHNTVCVFVIDFARVLAVHLKFKWALERKKENLIMTSNVESLYWLLQRVVDIVNAQLKQLMEMSIREGRNC